MHGDLVFESHKPRMRDQKNLTLLIIDDNPANIRLLELVFKKDGYRVITATKGTQARKLALEHQPALIMLDIMMPGEDGFEVVGRLKGDPRTASIPVIFLTVRDEVDAKIRGFDLGAVDYITKPFHVQEVLSRVRLHLKLSLATNSLIKMQAEKLKQIGHAQASLLVAPEDIPGARFGVYYGSCMEAGGDFYDVLGISDEIFGYFVGDVSGHDIGTSYMTAAVKALLRQNCIPIYEPAESMGLINKVLVEVLPSGKYMTACYARLNRQAMLITIVNAGHPPVVYLPKRGTPEYVEINGDVLGVFRDVHFEQRDIKVHKGDRFFLYTDGVTDRPKDGKGWEEETPDLLSACAQVKNMPISRSGQALKDLMLGRGAKPVDDVVALAIEV